jgi:signal transduction histidine kinase
MLAIALIPLLISSTVLFFSIDRTGEQLAGRVATAADQQASEDLQMRARLVAGEVSRYLAACEDDLHLAASLAGDNDNLLAFYRNRKDEVWYRSTTDGSSREVRKKIPRYLFLSLTDGGGRQNLLIRNDRLVTPSEQSLPGHEFPSDGYLRHAARLAPGEIHVSHLQGFHITKDEQLAGASEPDLAVGGARYRGYIRFSTPLFSPDGKKTGLISLALDHRHLMEFTQHILPGQGGTTVFPSYQSGNYAFMFDDEGWIITHPKYWDIRGTDRATGGPVPPYSSSSSPADIASGRIPFNLDHAGFIHPSYPRVSQLVRKGESGHLDTTNVGGARKIMAFAPIPYRTGNYGRHGIFGGITIGFQVDQFHEPARAVTALIGSHLRQHLQESAIILGLTVLLVILCAAAISRGITRPLALLTQEAGLLAQGERTTPVEVTSHDEIGQLADSFNRMAAELEHRRQGLLEAMDRLQASQEESLAERDFKENILESISSAILTFSPEGLLTSVNGTGRRLLGSTPAEGSHFTAIFHDWLDLSKRMEEVLHKGRPYGRESLRINRENADRYFDVGFFPIGDEGCRGMTLTIRDETEKERMRQEMLRMDRLVSLGRLSAGIAHEVRNPLTGISLLLDDLHDRLATDPEKQLLMAKALNEIERVERLVSSLLSYAAPPLTEFRPTDLNLIIEDTLLFFRKSCEHQGIVLTSNLAPVPPFPMDGDKIRQALFNLLKNALEALPEGGEISIVTSVDRHSACITITDSGPGIAEEDLPLLFEPFFTRKGAGTGLGLSITQRVVAEHHGTIAVSTSSGRGTAFTLRLPIPHNSGL